MDFDPSTAAYHSLEAYLIYTDQSYCVEWFHRQIIHALERAEKGEISNIMISMPPRHGKSRICSEELPTWIMGRNPGCEVVVAGYSTEFTKEFSKRARERTTTAEYESIFGTGLKQGDKAVTQWRLENGSSYLSVGVTASLTGKGANVLIIDDPHKDREEADSETQRKKIWDWYTSTAMSRVQPFKDGKPGIKILIMTRWHEDDLAGKLLEAERHGGDQWHKIVFPVLNEEKEMLWEKKLSRDIADVIKSNSARDWNSLYMQNPIPDDGVVFQKSWLKHFDSREIQPQMMEICMAIDPAISDAEGADWTSITVVGRYLDQPNFYILEQFQKRGMRDLEKCDKVFELKKKFNISSVGIESVAYQKAFIHTLENERSIRNQWVSIEEIKPKGKKEFRIRNTLEILYNQGRILHNKDNCDELEAQFLKFPASRHDDCLDSLEMVISMFNKYSYHQGAVIDQDFDTLNVL